MPNKFIFHTSVSRFFWHRWFVMVLTALCLLPQAQAQVSESVLKAEFAYGCAFYTNWLALPRRANIHICTNSNLLYPALKKLAGKTVKERVIVTQLLSQPNSDWRSCNLLVIDNSESGSWKRMKQQGALNTVNLLTIVDNSVVDREGAIITFDMGDDRVVFDVDRKAARLAGISLSSTFLYLARTVR